MVITALAWHTASFFVVAILIASIATSPINFYLVNKVIGVSGYDLCCILWRPSIGSLAMMIGVILMQEFWSHSMLQPGQIANVTSLSATGAIIYTTTVFGIWYWSKDPDSAEAWVLMKIQSFFRETLGSTGKVN